MNNAKLMIRIGGMVVVTVGIFLAYYTHYIEPSSEFTYDLISLVLIIVGFTMLFKSRSVKDKSKEISND